MKEQVEAFVEGIDYDSIVAAKDLIQEAEAAGGRLHVTGIGKPGHVSGYAASLLVHRHPHLRTPRHRVRARLG